MDNPIRSNGYEKYVIQIGWFQPEPNLLFTVLAQDILSKDNVTAKYLMKLLYPQSLGVGLPFLCPIVEEMTQDEFDKLEDEADMDETEKLIKQSLPTYETPKDPIKRIDLIYPN